MHFSAKNYSVVKQHTHMTKQALQVTKKKAGQAQPVTLRNNKAIRKPSAIQQYAKLSKNEYDNCIRALKTSIPKRDKNEDSVYAVYTEGDLLAFICIRYLIVKKRLGLSLLSQIGPSISNLFEICQHDFEQLRGWKLTFYSPSLKKLEWMKLSRSGYITSGTEDIDSEDLFEVEFGKMVDLYDAAINNKPKIPEVHLKIEDIELSRLAKELDEKSDEDKLSEVAVNE